MNGRLISILALMGTLVFGFAGCGSEEQQRQEMDRAQRRQAEINEGIRRREDLIKKWENHWKAEYDESQSSITGTVLEERTGMHEVQRTKTVTVHGSGGYVGPFWGYHPVSTTGSAEIKFKQDAPVYVIKVKIDPYMTRGTNVPSRVITVDVKDGPGMSKEGLEGLIVEGCKISFPRGNINYDPDARVSDNVGDDYNEEGVHVKESVAGIKYEYNPNARAMKEWNEPNRYGFRFNNDTWFGPETQTGSKEAGRIKVLTFPDVSKN